jgi:hypothetical protein
MVRVLNVQPLVIGHFTKKGVIESIDTRQGSKFPRAKPQPVIVKPLPMAQVTRARTRILNQEQ